mgnify:CR=1 FL=1
MTLPAEGVGAPVRVSGPTWRAAARGLRRRVGRHERAVGQLVEVDREDRRVALSHVEPPHEPVGVDYSGGEGGALRHWDDARYTITLPASVRGPATLRVRARYQTTTREYVEFLARENHTDDRGRDLLRLYNASGAQAAPRQRRLPLLRCTRRLPRAPR